MLRHNDNQPMNELDLGTMNTNAQKPNTKPNDMIKLADMAKQEFDTSFDEDVSFFDDMGLAELLSACSDEVDKELNGIGEQSDNNDDTLVVNSLCNTDNASSVDKNDVDKSDLIVEDYEDDADATKYTTMQALSQYYVNIPEDRPSPSVMWAPRCTYWDDWEQDVVLHREDENPPDGWFSDVGTEDGAGPSSEGAPMANRPQRTTQHKDKDH